MAIMDIQVPDIGDFDEVTVIELLVKRGRHGQGGAKPDHRGERQSLDGDSFQSHAGVVKAIKVKVGDKVKEGSVVLSLEAAGEGAAAPAPAPAAPHPLRPRCGYQAAAPWLAPAASSFGGSADVECDLLVLGGGPGGYSAAFRAADLGLKVVLVERYAHNRWRLPERGLHPVQSAAARGGGDGRGEPHGRSGRGLWRTQGRHRQAAHPQRKGHRQADRRPGRHGQDAQGHHRARLRLVRGRQPPRGGRNHRHGPGKNRQEAGRGVQESHHRRRLAGRAPALHARRSARGRLHRRAGSSRKCPSAC